MTATLFVASLIITLLAAVGARALVEFSPSKLTDLCSRRDAESLLTEILSRARDAALAAEILRWLSAAVLVLAGYSLWQSGADPAGENPSWPRLISGGAVGVFMLLVVEVWLPAAFARLFAEPFLIRTWRGWNWLSQILYPLVAIGRLVESTLRWSFAPDTAGPPPQVEDEFQVITQGDDGPGLLEEDAREMIKGVINLAGVAVSQIMTPRTEMFCIPLTHNLPEAAVAVAESGHSRVPVFNKSRDDIAGILHARDLLPELAQNSASTRPLAELLRPPFFVPLTKNVADLLEEFQRTRNHMAFVLDEYGGVAGLVTIEDALEEIVGEIADEYDDHVVERIRRVDERTVEALGRVPVRDINQAMGLALPEDADFDTIGGFVFHELGRVPTAGEKLVRDNLQVTVLNVTRRRIEKVRIERMNAAAETG